MSDRDLTVLVIFAGLLLLAAFNAIVAPPDSRVRTVTEPQNRLAAEGKQASKGEFEKYKAFPTSSRIADSKILSDEQDLVKAEPGVPQFRILFNYADTREVRLLPGVGVHLAEELVQYRDANFPIRNLDELLHVPGIGPTRLERIAPYLVFDANVDLMPEADGSGQKSAATQDLADPLR